MEINSSDLALMKTIDTIRRFGFKACAHHMTDCLFGHNAKNRLQLLRNALIDRTRPSKGISLVAPLTEEGSLSKVFRDLAQSLHDAGIPYQTFDTNPNPSFPSEELDGILTPRDCFRTLRFSHVIARVVNPFPHGLPVSMWRLVFWEFESGLQKGLPHISPPQGIVGMSDFNVSYFRREFGEKLPVCKLLYPFQSHLNDIPDSMVVRTKYGISLDDFTVFFNFDVASSPQRKNPIGVICAFAKAFAQTPKTKLLLKIMHGGASFSDWIRNVAGNYGIADKLLVVDSFLPSRDVRGLVNASDVYLSLHRGEGFGLGIAEAMSIGKPVIVTDYGATREFCNKSNAIPVPCAMRCPLPQEIDHPNYCAVEAWAEPDVEFAALALRRLHDDSLLRMQLGEAAKSSIQTQFALSRFKESAEAFLKC